MKAVVTGGAGFIGSHLCDHLIAQGHEVIALDDLSTGSESNLDQLSGNPNFELVKGSILDKALVGAVVGEADTVFHLAAAVGVHTIVDKPLESLRVNLHGTENVVEAAVRRGARYLVASTSEVYGKNDADGLTEDADRILGSPLKSRWSYAAAKGLDELVAYVHGGDSGLPCVITRFFNIVGPRQTGRYGMVVPRFVEQALCGEPITVHGDGTQRRCFGSVFDVVPALPLLLDTPAAHNRAVNLGGLEEVSVLDLAARVIELTGSASELRFVPYEEAYGEGYEDMRRRMPDTSLAAELVGYTPTRRLDDIILSIVEHHRTGLPTPRAAVA
ncbi:NAD-dependent epimerase/dehydratase family protein [Streptomonospora nanhaiensis]|uniref:UDP-glucose 4-epimerase n=1 Tax=Streptomonospora nanhaiensis TaxID=1323731 RepID=A0A853BQC9_9ACTN|nr:NAD-dependent epimerase/dehydratase family protein [Streptomonospora nanhaiensis]MBV2365082.1 NAD-dependent epimerase/dehydratase family protein [Streptomonospora nanhaiensis]NYI96711.1 UDP-glucose 4-epimerase [Streptomonospora nanhaiensis]